MTVWEQGRLMIDARYRHASSYSPPPVDESYSSALAGEPAGLVPPATRTCPFGNSNGSMATPSRVQAASSWGGGYHRRGCGSTLRGLAWKLLLRQAAASAIQEGEVPPSALPLASPVTARVGGLKAAVEYGGTAPGLVAGVIQVNALGPPDSVGERCLRSRACPNKPVSPSPSKKPITDNRTALFCVDGRGGKYPP